MQWDALARVEEPGRLRPQPVAAGLCSCGDVRVRRDVARDDGNTVGRRGVGQRGLVEDGHHVVGRQLGQLLAHRRRRGDDDRQRGQHGGQHDQGDAETEAHQRPVGRRDRR